MRKNTSIQMKVLISMSVVLAAVLFNTFFLISLGQIKKSSSQMNEVYIQIQKLTCQNVQTAMELKRMSEGFIVE